MNLLKRIFSRPNASVAALRSSTYFDAAWYLQAYPDVRAAGMDAALHYLEHGAHEGRNPGPRFSSSEYLRLHPGVAAAGENPVLHFMRTRRAGQEPPMPVYGDAARQAGGLPIRHGALVDPARDRALNQLEAASDKMALDRSTRSIDALLAQLPIDPTASLADPVPRILHFVYGFKNGGDIPYYGYMAIKSALHFNPGWRACYYTMNEPKGPIWDRIKAHVTLIRIGDFDYFMNARFHHYAHKADVIRLLIINRVGGVYLDLDTITRRSFEDLRSHEFVMGVQASGPDSSSGMANAVLVGKPGARFSTKWIEQYAYFRSRGRDDLWDYHSVKMPVHMMTHAPETVHILDYRAFFYPLWHAVETQLFTERAYDRFKDEFEAAYCFHLWNGASGPFLESLDDEFVRTSRSVYGEIARQVEGISLAKRPAANGRGRTAAQPPGSKAPAAAKKSGVKSGRGGSTRIGAARSVR
jgi:Glycosyltransferase sugar-binding region containing DXD motif